MTGKDLLKKLSSLPDVELQLPVRAGDDSGSREVECAHTVCGGEEGDDYVLVEDAEESGCDSTPVAIFLSTGEN